MRWYFGRDTGRSLGTHSQQLDLGKIGGSHLVPQFLFYTVEPMGEHELGMVTIDSEIDQVSIFEGIDDKSLCRIFIL